MAWTHLERRRLIQAVIDRRMEGKRGRGKPRIIILDDNKADETDEKILYNINK